MPISSVSVKAGILNTIAKSIYSDIRIKTREAVSNSIDNDAELFIITIDENTRCISFYDNGNGISSERFKEIFNSIGYGETRGNIQTNSYFGLGLISILQLGNNAVILSKTLDNQANRYTIETQKIFSEEIENKSVDDIKKFISSEELLSGREELSPLSDDVVKRYNQDNLPETFTEIILENVDDIIMNSMNNEGYVKELRKMLPLEPNYESPFFQHINSEGKLEEIKAILKNDEYCKRIKVFYGKIDEQEGYQELIKYYPEFVNDIIFNDADVKMIRSSDKTFAGYMLISSQDIRDNNETVKEDENDKKQDETGFWVRNKNFLVKSADFFQKPGGRKKIVDEPLTTWIYGEIFHKDMNNMLVVTRDEYLWDNKQFKKFYEELKGQIQTINNDYRDLWKKGKRVVEAIVEPFEEIKKKKIFNKFNTLLIKSQIINYSESDKYLEKIAREFSNPGIEDENAIIEKHLKEQIDDLVLADDVEGDIKVIVAKDSLGNKSFVRLRDAKTQNLVIKISPDLFSSFQTDFFGKKFTVNYVFKKNETSDLSINIDKSEIYINLSSQDFSKYRLTFIEYIMIAKVAYIESRDKEEMYKKILDLIGHRRYITVPPAIEPGDILKNLDFYINRF